jgi:phage/plasmid-like protein (TIGR03299 family)
MQLGTVLEGNFDAATALKEAHLSGWNVRKEAIRTASGLVIPGQWGVIYDNPVSGQTEVIGARAGKGGVVGDIYSPIQNEEHTGILDALVGESGAWYHAAGQHHGGRDVFLCMELPEHISVQGVDDIKVYLTAMNNHSGDAAFRLLVNPVRMRCTNMQAAMIRGAKRKFTIRHTTNARQNLEEARQALGLTFKYLEGFEAEAEKLLDQAYTEAEFDKLAKQLMGDPEEATSKRNATSIQTAIDGLRWSFLESPTNEVIRGTKWAAYQAVTEYADWMFPVRGDNKSELRALRTVEGRNDELKLSAWDALVLS